MDTRPLYFGKNFFQKPKAEKAWAALSRNCIPDLGNVFLGRGW